MNFEHASFIQNVEERPGVALEKELLGEINLTRYKELAIEGLASEKLREKGTSLTLRDIKTRNKEMYDELIDGARKEYLKNLRNPILSEKEMFNIVKKSQTGKGSTLFIVDMKKSLAERLKIETSAIDFYSALGTNADFCGVDGIFTINISGRSFDVTIDLTKESLGDKTSAINKKINAGGKYLGDVVLNFSNPGDDYVRDRDANLLPEFTETIVKSLERRMSNLK